MSNVIDTHIEKEINRLLIGMNKPDTISNRLLALDALRDIVQESYSYDEHRVFKTSYMLALRLKEVELAHRGLTED